MSVEDAAEVFLQSEVLCVRNVTEMANFHPEMDPSNDHQGASIDSIHVQCNKVGLIFQI